MSESDPRVETQTASDGYPIHVLVWPSLGEPRGRVVILHGVQSHGGWYHGLGKTLAAAGYETHFPDRRGSGANSKDRGHAPSVRRLVDDVAERLKFLKSACPSGLVAVAGISWGGKLALLTASDHPRLVDALILVCPGLHPRVGVSTRDRLRIAWAFFTNRHKRFPVPLSDPALFTDNPDGQRFIAEDALGVREATAGLLAISTFIDRRVPKAASRVKQPVLLMLAGKDRIVDNSKTLEFFESLPSVKRTLITYDDGQHTLEFEADPKVYAVDLCRWLNACVAE